MCILLLICTLMLSSCCTPREIKVYVKFKNADPRLQLYDYDFKCDFGSSANITFDVPKGYDHTKLKGTAEGYNINYYVSAVEETDNPDYKKFKDSQDYWFVLDKTVTFKIEVVKRSCTAIIDLSDMTKNTYNINLEKGMEGFQVLIVSKDKTDTLIKLGSKDVLETIDFVNNSAEVEYGKYAILVHNTNVAKRSYNALYSDISERDFVMDKNIGNIGTLRFGKYPVAKKGNTYYNYNYNSQLQLFYLGEIKENINLQASIPNFEKEKGFEIERKPNIFYLFTNLSQYNSDILTMEAYSSVVNYSGNLDTIEGNTVQKIESNEIYNDRYDVYKIYLGKDLDNDPLLESADKAELNKDLYFEISAIAQETIPSHIDRNDPKMGAECFNYYLLFFEKQKPSEGYKIPLSEISSANGKRYIKLSYETLLKFCQNRDMVRGQTVYEYLTGSAILYPELDYTVFQNDRLSSKFMYTRVWLTIDILSNTIGATSRDFHFNLYLKNESTIKYGVVDYHNSSRDCIYFLTSDLFDGDKYKNTLYAEIRGKEYKDFRTMPVRGATFVLGFGTYLNMEPIKVKDFKNYNGVKDFPINLKTRETLDEYSLTVKINIEDKLRELTPLDFSYLSLPASISNAVYLSEKSEFSQFKEFIPVTSANKETFKENKLIKFSSGQDLYYFVRIDGDYHNDFDIEMRLDPNDSTTCISKSQDLYDITGEKRFITINDNTYYIKVISQDDIYSLLTNYIYVVQAGS